MIVAVDRKKDHAVGDFGFLVNEKKVHWSLADSRSSESDSLGHWADHRFCRFGSQTHFGKS